MPENFKSKNGATLSGHSAKWSDENRRKNSHDAGQGSRGSRNQGTGAAGKANTVASAGTDTSKMNPHEKLKYFNSLGLLNPTQKQQLADMDAARAAQAAPKAPEASAPKAEPATAPKAQNPVKELSDRLMKIFAQKPNLIQGIVQALQAVPKEQMKDTAQRVLDSMEGNSSTEPTEVFSTVMGAIEGPGKEDDLELDVVDEPAPEARPEPRDRTASMTEEEFRKTNEYLGDKFVQSMIDQANQFEEADKALFMIDMAIENVDDVNDVRAVRNSMASAADDLAANGFELKGREEEEEVPDELDFSDEEEVQSAQAEPEEGSIDWIRKITNNAFRTNGTAPIESYDSYADLAKNNKDLRLLQSYMDMTARNEKTKPLYDLAMHKLNDFNSEEGEDSRFINIADAFFSILKDGEDVQQSSGSEGSEESTGFDVSKMSPGVKHAYERDKEAYDAPDLETGLDILRKSKGHGKQLKELLEYFADEMKKEGVKPASINKTLNHYMSQLKDNYYKFLKAQNSMIDNAEAYDPDEGSELEHNMLSFESGLEDYDRGNLTNHEEAFIDLYNQLHGK